MVSNYQSPTMEMVGGDEMQPMVTLVALLYAVAIAAAVYAVAVVLFVWLKVEKPEKEPPPGTSVSTT